MVNRLKEILNKLSGPIPLQIILLVFFFIIILIPNVFQIESLSLNYNSLKTPSIEFILFYLIASLGFVFSIINFFFLIQKWSHQNKKRKAAIQKNKKLQSTLNDNIDKKLNPAPYYSIEKVQIENFKGIKNIIIEIPPGTPWIFLTGENGYGKTSILQGIASSLDGYNDTVIKLMNNGTNLSSKLTNEKKPFGVYKMKNGKSLLNRRHQLDARFEYIYCYGSSRLDTYSESSTKKNDWASKSLYDSQTLLENIEFQLTRWFFKMDDNEFRKKFEYVTNLFVELLNLDHIEIDRKKDKVIYYEKDEYGNVLEGVDILQLAAGYRNIVSMIGDLIVRVYDSDPNIIDPKEFRGIVIIDEFELHLHPKYQKVLPNLFSKIFPQIQFIISTHSPVPLLGAPEGSVFLNVTRTKEDGIRIERLSELEKEIKDLLPNSILSSPLFGFTEIFPSQHKKGEKIRTETSYEKIKYRDKLKDKLQARKGTETDEFLKNFIRKRANEK